MTGLCGWEVDACEIDAQLVLDFKAHNALDAIDQEEPAVSVSTGNDLKYYLTHYSAPPRVGLTGR